MAVNKVVYGASTLVDLTGDTVTPDDVAEGVTFHGADGVKRSGTRSSAPVAHASTHATGGSDPITPASIGAATTNHTHTPAGIGAQPARLTFTGKTVATSAWASDVAYADYPYRAAVACAGVTAEAFADVVLSPEDAAGGNFAPVCATYAGGLYLYAKAVPDAALTIPTIVVWR